MGHASLKIINKFDKILIIFLEVDKILVKAF